MAAPNVAPSIDADFIEQVQQFSLRVAHAGKGGRLAEQKTPARGQGLEFADFKPYVAGDDLRAIDWNIYRRLGRVFVRVFEEQQDLPVYIFLDQSASMFLEQPARIHAAKQAALALGAIALNQNNAMTLLPFDSALNMQYKAMSGKHQVMRLAALLQEGDAASRTSLATVLKQFAGFPLRQGLVVLVSDFFDNDGIAPVIDALAQIRHRLMMVQVTQPWDSEPLLHPELGGHSDSSNDLRLQDCETSAFAEVQLTPEVIKQYQSAYQDFNQQIAALAQARGAGLLRLNASDAVLPQLATLFNHGGLQL